MTSPHEVEFPHATVLGDVEDATKNGDLTARNHAGTPAERIDARRGRIGGRLRSRSSMKVRTRYGVPDRYLPLFFT
ncbi:hypothetical protein ACQP2U_15830 [Nocardia sp. CA-084685]|uniref:hypothetical protein n=1 Tax=Nocardia sp. CA-084685 TaxID=3239970 RepID=UPI003D98DDF1